MGSLSDYAELEILDHVLGVGAYTSPTAVYLALSTADFLDAGSGAAEPVGNGYIRKVISFGAAASRVSTQDAIVQYDAATGAWGTITHWGIFDAATAGNLIAHGAFSASKAIISGNTPSVASGQTTVTFTTGGCSTYLADAILDHLLDATTYTPESVYVALCDTAITDTNTGVTISELIMTGYARNAKTGGGTDWDTAAAGATANKTLIDFSALTGTGETVEAICLTNNSSTSAGEVLFYDNSESQAIASGDTVQLAIGAFDITLD